MANAPVADEPCKRCGGPGWYTSHTTGYSESIPRSVCNPQGVSVERLEKDPFLAAQLWRKPVDADGSLLGRVLEHVGEYGESMASSTLLSVRSIARRNVETRIEAELAATSAASVPDFAGAYEGAREDLAIWKRRALEAERDLRAERETSSRLVAQLNAENGPTRMGDAAPLASAEPKLPRGWQLALNLAIDAIENAAPMDWPVNWPAILQGLKDLRDVLEQPQADQDGEVERMLDDDYNVDAAPQAPAGWRWTLHPAGLHPDVYAAAAPQASAEALDTLTIDLDYADGASVQIEVHGTEKMLRRLEAWLSGERSRIREQARNAALEEAAQVAELTVAGNAKPGTPYASGTAKQAAARIRALKSTPAPTAAEGSEDDMLTIAYLAGAQAEKERAALEPLFADAPPGWEHTRRCRPSTKLQVERKCAGRAGGAHMNQLVYRIGDLQRVIGLSKWTVYNLMKSGDFPHPIQLTGKAVGWRASDVEKWVNDRPVSGDPPPIDD
ncbi:transcriptional regulator [Bordetella bronchiseptica KM22]|nr:transcriptional regulator [Bordetella bronchiseptica KM22]